MARLSDFIDTTPPSVIPMVSLESHLERIALEAGFVANLIDNFRNVIPQFSIKLKEIQQRLFVIDKEQKDYTTQFLKEEKEVVFAAKNQDYLHFGSRLILVPEGFKGELKAYLEVLNKVVPILYTAESTVLSEYAMILSSFITNKEDKISIKDYTGFFKKVQKDREAFVEELKQFFQTSNHQSQVPFKSVVKRMTDVELILKEADKLSKVHSQAKMQNVQNATTHCVELLDIIIEQVNNNTLSNINANAATAIAQGAFEVAKYVELIGVVYYDTMVALNVVDQLSKTLTGK